MILRHSDRLSNADFEEMYNFLTVARARATSGARGVPLELGAGVAARRRAEYDESFMAQVCQPAKSRCLVSFSMAVFAKCRLEGRALEHAFSGDKGFGIHMCSSTGVWSWVRGDEAKQITLAMRCRVSELRSDFEAQGLFVQAADSRVRVDEENHSVDLRAHIPDKQAGRCLGGAQVEPSIFGHSSVECKEIMAVDAKSVPIWQMGFEDRQARQATQSLCRWGHRRGAL